MVSDHRKGNIIMRSTFTKADRAAFTAVHEGDAVEWRNGGTWWPAVRVGAIQRDSIGMEYFMIRNLATTRTIHNGQAISAYPGNVRIPAEGTVRGTGAGRPQMVVRDGSWIPA